MERVAKLVLIITITLIVLASNGEGGRMINDKKQENVDQPQNFLGGFGSSGGFVPSPGGGVAFGLGPSGYCLFPGPGCVRVQPSVPGGGSTGTGVASPP